MIKGEDELEQHAARRLSRGLYETMQRRILCSTGNIGLALQLNSTGPVRGEFVLTRRPGVRKGHRSAFPK
jgi:hypothetical protein